MVANYLTCFNNQANVQMSASRASVKAFTQQQMFSSRIVTVEDALAGIKSGAFAATGVTAQGAQMTKPVYDTIKAAGKVEIELVAIQRASLGTWIDDSDTSRSALLPSFQCMVKQGETEFSVYLDFGTTYHLAKTGKGTVSATHPPDKNDKPVVYKRGPLMNEKVLNLNANVQLERDQVKEAATLLELWYKEHKVPA